MAKEGPAGPTDARILGLPKPELHVHLDGSLRPQTMLELAGERGVDLPADDPRGLAAAMRVRPALGLEQYLERFDLTLRLMQDEEALERVAYELAADCAAETVEYVEVRFCPALCTRGGLAPARVLDAALRGLARARTDHDVVSSVIVCALRTLPPATSEQMAELAIGYRHLGVCGLDLAGAEAGNPVRDHVDALRRAARAGLPVTIHAGEGSGPESIREALEVGGAHRIGHGTRLSEDPGLLRRVRDEGVPLEVCLTSNLQTGAAASYETHPLRRYLDEGIRVCLCTDNRLMSGVTLSQEYEHARDELGLRWRQLVTIARNGFEAAFAPADVRAAHLERLDAVSGL